MTVLMQSNICRRPWRRYAQQYGEEEDGGSGAVQQQALQPTSSDAKLWVVHCGEGQEREAVVCLLQKCYDLRRKGTPLLIKAVFCQDHLKARLRVVNSCGQPWAAGGGPVVRRASSEAGQQQVLQGGSRRGAGQGRDCGNGAAGEPQYPRVLSLLCCRCCRCCRCCLPLRLPSLNPIPIQFPPPPLQGYIYVEAHKEAHVKDAMRGLRMIFNSRPPKLVPLREMVDAISVPRGTEKSIGGCAGGRLAVWVGGWVAGCGPSWAVGRSPRAGKRQAAACRRKPHPPCRPHRCPAPICCRCCCCCCCRGWLLGAHPQWSVQGRPGQGGGHRAIHTGG